MHPFTATFEMAPGGGLKSETDSPLPSSAKVNKVRMTASNMPSQSGDKQRYNLSSRVTQIVQIIETSTLLTSIQGPVGPTLIQCYATGVPRIFIRNCILARYS
jgi:hypothetical protein